MLEAVIFNPLATVEANEELIAFSTYDAVVAYEALIDGTVFKFKLWEDPSKKYKFNTLPLRELE